MNAEFSMNEHKDFFSKPLDETIPFTYNNSMSTQLSLWLLGVPQITLAGEPVTSFVSSKAQALLIYLAVTGRAYSREELAAHFWGDMLDASARANLNKALSNLRKLVGSHLDAEPRQPVRLHRARCWIDVIE